MIIEPVPTQPRGSGAALRRVLALLAPAAMLVAVVGLAVGGQGADADEGATTPAAVAASSAPAGGPSAAPTPDLAPSPVADLPAAILGIPVLTPTEAAATSGTAGPGTPGPWVLVGGLLSVDTIPPACTDRWGAGGALCERLGVLAEAGAPPEAGPAGRHGRHVHPLFPAGVRWPRNVGVIDQRGAVTPVPVVVLGRFGDPRAPACSSASTRCEAAFVVERVVWADGGAYRRTTSLDPALELDPDDDWRAGRDAARQALDGTGLLAVSALVAPATLARLDPEAAAALAAAVPADDPDAPTAVWYVRGIAIAGDQARTFAPEARWVVVDDATGRVLARSADPPG